MGLLVAAGAPAHGDDLHQPGPRRHRDPPGGRRRGSDAAGPGPPRAEPAHDRDRGVSDVHADGGARPRAERGLGAERRDQRQQRRGPAALARRVDVVRARSRRKVPALYSTFRTDIATIQHGYVKQAIRQSLQEVVGNEEIAAIIGPKKAEVTSRVSQAAGAAALALRDHREAVHHQRAARAAVGDRGHQPEERDAAAGAHGAERAAEEPVPGAGRLDQGGGPGQGDPGRGGGAGQGQPPAEREHHADAGAVRDEQALERADAAGDGRRDADDSAAGAAK